MRWFRTFSSAILMISSLALPVGSAKAELVLSQLIVELAPGDHPRADVEIFNHGEERAFVAIDPREVVGAGSSAESSRTDPDPEKLGLLVSPSRMVLEPGQHRLLRIASIAPSERERVYRVTVKPVVGQLSAPGSGLKLLVGYDVLVLVRPAASNPHVSAVRSGDKLILRNDGNVSVELVDGRECDPSMTSCKELAGGRLYSGAEKTLDVAPGRRAEYKLKVGTRITSVQF